MERKTYSGCNRTVSFDCFYGNWLWNMNPVLTQKQFTGENRLDTRENCILHRYFSITFPDHPRSQSNHSQHVQLNMCTEDGAQFRLHSTYCVEYPKTDNRSARTKSTSAQAIRDVQSTRYHICRKLARKYVTSPAYVTNLIQH